MSEFQISGETRLFGIFADPVKQVQTPQFMNRIFKRLKIDAVCVPFEVDSDHLEQLLNVSKHIKNFEGAVITIPHKIPIMKMCDQLAPNVLEIGTVNAIRFNDQKEVIGDTFDGSGFVLGLLRNNVPLDQTSRAYQVGAGGAGRAIAFNLLHQGVTNLTIYNKPLEQAQLLIDDLQKAYPNATLTLGDDQPTDMTVCINATPVGMIGMEEMIPFSLDHLDQETWITEVIMRPDVTLLLKKAQEKGMPIVKGVEMLKGQATQMAAFLLNDPAILKIDLKL